MLLALSFLPLTNYKLRHHKERLVRTIRFNRYSGSLEFMKTLVQFLALYTDPESHNAERYRQTETEGRTDDDANTDHTV